MGSWGWERAKLPPYGKTGNNLDAGAGTLRDPEGMDFRLKPNSPANDAGRVINRFTESFHGNAPDLGAHEFGNPEWKDGCSSHLRN